MNQWKLETIVRGIATRSRWPALVTATGLGVVGLVAALWAEPGQAPPAQAPQPTYERWGIDQLRIYRTAEGHLLDLRYRVVDPARAESLLAEDSEVHVIHEESGARLPVPSTPKTGALRNTGTPQAGRSYFALFTNPGGLVRRGDRVSVVVGALDAELTVQ